MNNLERFRGFEVAKESLKKVKGGIYSQVFDCTLENGESFQVYALNWDGAFAYIDRHNSNSSYYAIVGCEV